MDYGEIDVEIEIRQRLKTKKLVVITLYWLNRKNVSLERFVEICIKNGWNCEDDKINKRLIIKKTP